MTARDLGSRHRSKLPSAVPEIEHNWDSDNPVIKITTSVLGQNTSRNIMIECVQIRRTNGKSLLGVAVVIRRCPSDENFNDVWAMVTFTRTFGLFRRICRKGIQQYECGHQNAKILQ